MLFISPTIIINALLLGAPGMARGRLSALCKWSGLHFVILHIAVHHIWVWKAKLKSMLLCSSAFQSLFLCVLYACMYAHAHAHVMWFGSFWHDWLDGLPHIAVIQDGRCERGNVGGAIQQFKTCAVSAQLEVLPVRVHWRLLHCTLPISKTNDMLVGQIAIPRKSHVLQHEMTMKRYER